MTVERASNLLTLNRPREALEVLSQLGEAAGSARVECLRCSAFTALGEWEQAELAAARARAADPDDEQGFRLGAITAYNRHKLRDALMLAREAVRLAPREPRVHAVMALVALNIKDFGSAREHAQTLLELDPNWADAHVVQARVLMAEHRLIHAERELKVALALEPDNPEALALLADVVGGHDERLAQDLRVAALQAAPQDADLRRNVLRRGGLAAGGSVLAIGKIGGLGKLTYLLMIRPVRDALPHLVIPGFIAAVLGYVAVFASTRWRRHKHGRTLPPLVWEGLRSDRRNADLLWLVWPSAIVMLAALVVVGAEALLGQPLRALWFVLTPAGLLVLCWRLRQGDARQRDLGDLAHRVRELGLLVWERRALRRRPWGRVEPRWVPSNAPIVQERWNRAVVMAMLSVGLGGLLIRPFGPEAFAPGIILAAVTLGALLDGRDRPYRGGIARVARAGSTDHATRTRLAIRAALKVLLGPLVLLQILGRTHKSVRFLHDRFTGTELIGLLPDRAGGVRA